MSFQDFLKLAQDWTFGVCIEKPWLQYMGVAVSLDACFPAETCEISAELTSILNRV